MKVRLGESGVNISAVVVVDGGVTAEERHWVRGELLLTASLLLFFVIAVLTVRLKTIHGQTSANRTKPGPSFQL
jgi:hypothetical protein